MQITVQTMIRLFEQFRDGMLRKQYGYGNYSSTFYKRVTHDLKSKDDLYGCNQFIETEDDYKVKLGGFLEIALLPHGFTVHSEMERVYRNGGRPDLTIHAVQPGETGSWTTNDAREKSLRCVIELKGASIRKPNYWFGKNVRHNVAYDMNKLSLLPPEVIKCFVFLDEGNGVDADLLRQHRAIIEYKGITVLSNNPQLHLLGGPQP